ncbi:probable disease resistance protein At4g27220 [Durio zibethinus]|uniref:Probable disease resistance protein At4g27220 n=1 Tax=Durio zibethinus TaxID=66656 RepID=A0A6P5ZLG8_DURZI|nr:probable disease resistance protein At4g27220 [Durio zibethinus]
MGCGFCESALSNCVGTLLVDWVAKPVGRQFNYICHFHHNVEKLKKRKEDLKKARDRLQHDIEDAERQLQEIEDDVKDLLSQADIILSDETLENEMQRNMRCFIWCPNWSRRYWLSKKAMKNTLVIGELIEKINKFGQPGRVGYRSRSTNPTIEFLSSKDFMVFESSKKAFNPIIEALQDDKVSMIGLWGMPGVGKTTLVREVGIHAKKLNLFDRVAIATVSQKPNFETIQDEIAKDLDFDMKNAQGRRSIQEFWSKLRELQKDKRILIILDDVWAKIDLKEKIGIPFAEDHKGCKILLTTRRQHVCDAMECQRTIPLGCLEDNEARALFNAKAGLNDSSGASIKDVATKVIKKCKGLPIAIVTLASALKGKNRHGWEAAYRRLENRKLLDIEDIDQQNAYLCFEVSFDYLKNKETKMCFLLCSLFPEDYEIYVEELVRYAWGLELYKGMGSIEAVRSEVLAAMDILRNSCLLLNCGERHVKMHDLVRDFALWIASNRTEFSFMIKSEVVELWPKDESFEPYKAVSFKTSRIVELPKGLLCPNLKILVLGGDKKMTTSSEFFEGMTALKVCALNSRLISPDAFQFQTNLTTLHLESCKLLDISVLGQLKKLEVLSFSCSDIKELPEEIGDLDNLKLLDLSYCEQLQRIPPQLIRRLSQLEELYLHGCGGIEWATESTVQEESFSSLSELNSLSNLKVLSLEVSSEHVPRDFVFCKLQRFYLCVGFGFSNFYRRKMDFEICPFSRSLKIEGSVIEACKQLFGDTESLNLKNMVGYPNLVPSLESGQVVFSKLTSLGIESCEHMKCLIDTTKQQVLTNAIPILQSLERLEVKSCDEMQVLFQIAELRSIQQGPRRHVSLQSLKVVTIFNCYKLRHLFPTYVAESLGQLEALNIFACWELEEIIPKTEVSNINLQSLREVHTAELRSIQQGPSHHVSLQSLKVVTIDKCNKLRYLFPTSVAQSLGQLEELCISECLELEEIIPKTEVSNINLPSPREGFIAEERSIQEGTSHHVSLQSLKLVRIDNCNKLRYLFPTSVAQSLGQLEELLISDCLELEEIIPKTEVSNINLPSPREGFIAELRSIEQGPSHHVSLQSLKVVRIDNCNKLRHLFPTSVAKSLGQLETLNISECLELEEIIPKTEIAELRSIQQGPSHHVSLQSLKVVTIVNCNKLRYLFPTSVAKSLGQLETLNITDCLELEEIIPKTEVANINLQSLREVYVSGCNNLTSLSSLSHGQILEKLSTLGIWDCSRLEYTFPISMAEGLPQLNEVSLGRLPELKGRDGNDIVLTLPSLQELCVDDCPQLTPFIISAKIQGVQCGKLRYILSPTIARNLPQLSSLWIYECEKLEQIIEKDGQTSSQGHHLQPICLPSLTGIHIYSCENLKCLFPVSVAHGLPKLKVLHVDNVSKLEQVFEQSGDEANGSEEKEKVIQLPQLGTLHLQTLPNLVSFSPAGYHFVFPSLQSLSVRGCPNITTSFSVDSEQSGHAKTEAIRTIDEDIEEESTRAQQTTWPIGSDISLYVNFRR